MDTKATSQPKTLRTTGVLFKDLFKTSWGQKAETDIKEDADGSDYREG